MWPKQTGNAVTASVIHSLMALKTSQICKRTVIENAPIRLMRNPFSCFLRCVAVLGSGYPLPL